MATQTPPSTHAALLAQILLPPSDTHTTASTWVGTLDYIPCTPSPVEQWRPTEDDINGNSGRAAEHAAFIATHHYLYGIQIPTAIRLYCNCNICGLAPLPVLPPVPRSGTLQVAHHVQLQWTADNDTTIASSPDMPMLKMHMQWQAEDAASAAPTSPMPFYHSNFQCDCHTFLTATQVANIYNTIPVLEEMKDEECEEACTPSPNRPQPSVYLGPGWVHNTNYITTPPSTLSIFLITE